MLPESVAAHQSVPELIDWTQHASWSTLSFENDFAGLLRRWQRWRQDPKAPRVLHEVLLCRSAPSLDQILASAQEDEQLMTLGRLVAPQCFGLIDGLHRILIDEGQVHLTLCVGDQLKRLRELQFQADVIVLGRSTDWSTQTELPRVLANLSRRGTLLLATSPICDLSINQRREWISRGFCLMPTSSTHVAAVQASTGLFASYNPTWRIQRTRHATRWHEQEPARCTVVGAGLAGASVAAAMARRGWTVTVLESQETLAAGASGAPLGLMSAHLSADDCQLSQISRSGMRMVLSEADRLLPKGQDWDLTGIFEHYVDKRPTLPPQWSREGSDWCQVQVGTSRPHNAHPSGAGVFHKPAGWLKPATLVRAWLAHQGIQLRCGVAVDRLQYEHGRWHLFDRHGLELDQSELVVLANACNLPSLLDSVMPHQHSRETRPNRLHHTRGMRGLMTFGLQASTPADVWPPQPINGHGFAASGIPSPEGQRWFIGSSYQDAQENERPDQDNHQRNLDQLGTISPRLARVVAEAIDRGAVQSWKGVRCTTHDHLPVVGPVDAETHPDLWVCCGLGSRGISLAMICAEILASRVSAQPLPMPAKLAMRMDPRGGG